MPPCLACGSVPPESYERQLPTGTRAPSRQTAAPLNGPAARVWVTAPIVPLRGQRLPSCCLQGVSGLPDESRSGLVRAGVAKLGPLECLQINWLKREWARHLAGTND
jgi:hypothetical protein